MPGLGFHSFPPKAEEDISRFLLPCPSNAFRSAVRGCVRTLQTKIKLRSLRSARRVWEQLTPYSLVFRDDSISTGSINSIITFDETSDVGEVPDKKGRTHKTL